MHPAKRTLLWINVVGGVAVLGSYAWGIATHADPGAVWGGVPEWLKPAYTASMLAAAAGYFLFTGFVLFAVDAERVRIAGRWRFGSINLLYSMILVPSALWMPLTFLMLERPTPLLWVAIRLLLGLVGLGSIGLLIAIASVRPRRPAWAHLLALVGLVAFCVQTALLDALVWPAYFPFGS
jgi:hypothetical protein